MNVFPYSCIKITKSSKNMNHRQFSSFLPKTSSCNKIKCAYWALCVFSRSSLYRRSALWGHPRVLCDTAMQGEKKFTLKNDSTLNCFLSVFFLKHHPCCCCTSGGQHEERDFSSLVQRWTWDQGGWTSRLHRGSSETGDSPGEMKRKKSTAWFINLCV